MGLAHRRRRLILTAPPIHPRGLPAAGLAPELPEGHPTMNQASLRAPFEQSKALLALALAAGNAAQNGASVDRTGYSSAIVDVVVGHTGAPTGGTVTLQMQDSADGVTFANYGSPVSAPITAGNAGGQLVSLGINLMGARQFVRVVSQSAPTGGASPAASTSATLRLFGPDRLPAL